MKYFLGYKYNSRVYMIIQLRMNRLTIFSKDKINSREINL